MSEYKQVIFDILSPLTEQAESELLADEPLKDQIMAMRKMSGTVQSIMNLYSRKHAMDGMRIDLKMAELEKELKAAEKIPAGCTVSMGHFPIMGHLRTSQKTGM